MVLINLSPDLTVPPHHSSGPLPREWPSPPNPLSQSWERGRTPLLPRNRGRGWGRGRGGEERGPAGIGPSHRHGQAEVGRVQLGAATQLLVRQVGHVRGSGDL